VTSVPLPRAAARALLPFLLHGAARVVDDTVGVLLHTTLDLPGFPLHALALVRPGRLASTVLLWAVAGCVAWALVARHDRPRHASWADTLVLSASLFWPLYLRPVCTALGLLSLLVRPVYPYGFTLPVALTQDWGPAQDVLAAAAFLATWARLPAARLSERHAPAWLGLAAFAAYVVLTPSWARTWQGHPGNEPKTLRMAVSIGHWLSLDVEPVSASMEDLPADAAASVPAAFRTVARESSRLAGALAEGPASVGAGAITATRITRQTIRGKEGGVYHVLAPGPSVLLAPALRVDRWLNQRAGIRDRLLASVLLWNALAAALVSATYLLLRDATGRPGLSAVLAGGFALLPPSLFYFFQFYPEMLGALALAVVLRALLFVPWWTPRRALLLGLLLAAMPWLHQKFLPVWGVLVLAAVGVLVAQMARLGTLMRLLLPQALTFALFTLYNFAITGSARPDALFLAWGPRGIATTRLGQGLLGLVLDARFGILPGVPLLLLAGAGFVMRAPGAARLRAALPVAIVYYVTVAAADNWSGAVCNLGRYFMPVAPYAVALVGVALSQVAGRGGLLALSLALAGWSVLLARALWLDPHAANDSAVLFARSAFADPNLYLPNLFLRTWDDAAPGLWARVLLGVCATLALGAWWRREAARPPAPAPPRSRVATVVATLFVVALAAAFLLERWPATRRAAAFANRVEAGADETVFVSGAAEVGRDAVRARRGPVRFLVRAPQPVAALRVAVHGPSGLVSWPGRAPLVIPRSGLIVDVPLTVLGTWTGRRGATESLLEARVEIDADQPVELVFSPR
jgi:hypothetical protein